MTAADQHIAVHGALQNVAVVSPLLMLAPRLTFSSSCRDPRARASGLLSGVLEGSPPTCAAGAKKFQVRGLAQRQPCSLQGPRRGSFLQQPAPRLTWEFGRVFPCLHVMFQHQVHTRFIYN